MKKVKWKIFATLYSFLMLINFLEVLSLLYKTFHFRIFQLKEGTLKLKQIKVIQGLMTFK